MEGERLGCKQLGGHVFCAVAMCVLVHFIQEPHCFLITVEYKFCQTLSFAA